MLKLQPVLNKKQLEKVQYYNTAPFSQAYVDKNEKELYSIVKTVRQNQWLSNNKIIADKPETAKHLIFNKPKNGSPLELFTNKLNDTLSKSVWIKPKSSLEDVVPWLWVALSWLDLASKFWLAQDRKTTASQVAYWLGKTAWEINKPIVAALEKPWVLFSKPVSETVKFSTALFQGSKWILNQLQSELVETKPQNISEVKTWASALIPESRNIEDLYKRKKSETTKKEREESWLNLFQTWILKTAEDFETSQAKTNILFWTTNNLSDYYNIHSLEEKRRNIIAWAAPDKKKELQKFYDDTWAWQMAIDIWATIAWDFVTWGILKSTATKIANPKVAKVISTLWDSITKYWMWANEILWATQAVNAIAYYATTWKYLYDWDKEATEAMANWLFSSVIRGWIKYFSKGTNNIADINKTEVVEQISSDEWFTRGFNLMMSEVKEKLWNKIQDYAEWQGIVPRIIEATEQPKTSNIVEKTIDEKQIDDLIAWLRKETTYIDKKASKFKNYIKGLWYWKEWENDTWNVAQSVVNNLYNKFHNVSDDVFIKRVGWTEIDKAELKALQVSSDAKNVIEWLQNVVDWVRKSPQLIKDFPKYIRLKSRLAQGSYKDVTKQNKIDRLNKLLNKNVWNEKLTKDITKRIEELEQSKWVFFTTANIWWKSTTLSLEQTEALIKRFDAENPELKAIADLYWRLNAINLDRLELSWIISKEQRFGLEKNPFYIPAQLTEDALASKWDDLYIDEWEALFKKLQDEWNTSLDFDLDTLDNFSSYIEKSFRISRKNDYISKIIDLYNNVWEDLTSLEWKNLAWFTKVKYRVDWVVKDAAIPNYLADNLIYNRPIDFFALNYWRKATQIVKLQATWLLAPLFPVSMIGTEFLQGLVTTKIKGWDINVWMRYQLDRFLRKSKNVNSWLTRIWLSSDVQKDMSDALSWYLSSIGWDFWFLWGSWKDITDEFVQGGRSVVQRAITKYSNFLWGVDKVTSRAPATWSNIVKQAKEFNPKVTEDDIKKTIFKHWDKELQILNTSKVNRDLKNMWISPELSSFIGRGIFDYFSAWRWSQSLWRYLPYANLWAASVAQLANLTKGNKKWIWIAATVYWAKAYSDYKYNFWLEQLDWESAEDFKARQELWEKLRTQPWYIKYAVGKARLWEDWKVYFDNLAVNNNTAYWVIYSTLAWTLEGIRNRGGDWLLKELLKSNSQFINQTTVFINPEAKGKEWLYNTTGKIPALVKWPLETLFNTDFRYWWKVYTEWMWEIDDENTTYLWRALSGLFNQAGWETNTKAVDRVISWANPENLSAFKKIKTELVWIQEDIKKNWLDYWDVYNRLTSLIVSSRKLVDKESNAIFEKADKYNKPYEDYKFSTKKEVNQIKDIKELENFYNTKTKEIYWLYWNGKNLDYLIDTIKDKKLELEQWKDDKYLINRNNTYFANEIYNLQVKWDEKWYYELMNKFKEFWFKKEKVDNIFKEVQTIIDVNAK